MQGEALVAVLHRCRLGARVLASGRCTAHGGLVYLFLATPPTAGTGVPLPNGL